jgi:hypothetical protein
VTRCSLRRGRWIENLIELVNIIKDTALASIFAVVRRDDFANIFPRNAHTLFKSPYSLVYYSLMSATLKSMVSCGVRDTIDFIFDEQLHLSDAVQAIYGTVIANLSADLSVLVGGRPIHGTDRKYLPLQAADLLAWHIRRWYHADGAVKYLKVWPWIYCDPFPIGE